MKHERFRPQTILETTVNAPQNDSPAPVDVEDLLARVETILHRQGELLDEAGPAFEAAVQKGAELMMELLIHPPDTLAPHEERVLRIAALSDDLRRRAAARRDEMANDLTRLRQGKRALRGYGDTGSS